MKRLIIWANLLGCITAAAQGGLQNNGNLRVFNGANLNIAGNLVNASTATFINNGRVYVKGDITNEQVTLSSGTGTLYLDGSTVQTINGTAPFRTNHLRTDNAAGIVLNNDLYVNGLHTYVAGILTATNNFLSYDVGASYTGSSDAAHVNGWVKKFGISNFIFPVGNNTYLRNIQLSNLSANSEFNVRYLQVTPNQAQLAPPLQVVDPNEYWEVNRLSGGVANVGLNWNNSKVAFPNWILGDIRTASWNGSLWTDVGGTASGNVTTTGNITSNSVSVFNYFTFASVTSTLPVRLISFSATRHSSYTRLNWVTQNEENVSHFEVERSDDSQQFYDIGTEQARNRHNRETYYLDDARPIRGTAWYRLRSVDLDGKQSLSRIVAVHEKDGNPGLQLFTNPVTDKIILTASNGLVGESSYRIYNMKGQLLQAGSLYFQGTGTYELPSRTRLVSGTYLLQVMVGGEVYRFKVVQQ